MDRFDLIQLSAALFLLNFFIHYYLIKSSDEKFTVDIMPFLILLVTSKLDLLVSSYTIFKLAVSLMLIIKVGLSLYKKRITPSALLSFSVLLAIGLLILLVNTLVPPIFILNILLIILGGLNLWTLVKHTQLTIHQQKNEHLESGFIHFFAALILGAGHTTFNLSLGLIIYIFAQVSDLYLALKHFHKQEDSKEKRLRDLETRFERSVEFESKKRTSNMADQVAFIREKSQKDPLSKAFNRNGIITEINALINDSSVKIFSIAMFDIDYFKIINDTKGHIVGDECIKFLSYLFMSNNRKTDLLGRYGGDEFILLMPHVNAPAAMEICDRLRVEVMQKSAPKFTISMGIATYPYDGKSFMSLLEVADQGLYIAKEDGKNKVAYNGNVPLIKK